MDKERKKSSCFWREEREGTSAMPSLRLLRRRI